MNMRELHVNVILKILDYNQNIVVCTAKYVWFALL